MNTTNNATKFEEMLKRQNPFFVSLFNLTDDEIKVKVDKMTMGKHSELIKNSDVHKTIVNSKPRQLELSFYDSLLINWMGIVHRPEHGREELILEFSKYLDLVES